MADDQRETATSSPPTTNTDRKEREAPRGEGRHRSRSPRRDRDRREDRPRRKDAGFKWKEKRRDDDEGRRDRDAGLQRGYKDHYRPRPRSRSRSPPPRRSSPKRDERDSYKTEDRMDRPREDKDRKEKKEKKPAPAVPTQPMIIVYVNDRLGTKKAIPCFPTDPIKDFKVIVASMIGRQPHEILLKRQGERPFKDQLTLQDYGVSNNVQLDLEVDTGD
ncbi:hypothetical protein LTR99_007159 [Exophiala xenobiotica]|uniref:Ubiquitin-like modifier HUB1 n=1 Tax=Vermiconidia calcicola TaxID=1690605 RepID=A0AAV9PXR0_9PEZI|nr:hypothetical protein H2202_001124 [Exophiala xenobiotica]KAK5528952.1 hypothetical protein LTR25_010137 [Vermiconidia calcicola]KAK5544881.1 hypothetical protein LTR23_004010 [Chaetothyriales sp. CCFEE 6169]KAK5209054.1 hypothetical protein LTR41_005453 [Exophiala xenobiotica]KAK5221019.1 hypothetical protein LTR72_006577 [Exophiala xenobiotica]